MTRKNILIVDDDPSLLRLLSIRLEAAGYEVATADSGEKALAIMANSRPHVIIADLRMDGMDGMTLFSSIHERDPSLPVIILTAHGTIPDAVDATQRGVFSYLTKPYNSKQLIEQIQKAILTNSDANGVEEQSDDWRNEIITRSAVMEEVLSHARLVAQSDASVFICGDSGTGKELLARAIHKTSHRSEHPFIAVNCSAIPEPLLESELFGHTKGSFTGATRSHRGLFQAADKGTLFLDEIGDMPLAFQSKLLRVLQERQVRPVGSTEGVSVDVRVVSASHRDLDTEMKAGRFREDLYYRLNVVMLELPSLNERREDIPLLAKHFLSQISDKSTASGKGKHFSPDAMELLVQANWPGNVRQLRNVVEQATALSTGSIIPATLVQKAIRDKPGEILSLAEARSRFERNYLAQLLKITNGNVKQAARLARRNRTDFYKLLNRHQLDPAVFKQTDR